MQVSRDEFTHTLLPFLTPTKSCLDEIDGLRKNFLWGNKPSKYRADILESKQIGGLGYPTLSMFTDAFKTSWAKRIYTSNKGSRIFPTKYSLDKFFFIFSVDKLCQRNYQY